MAPLLLTLLALTAGAWARRPTLLPPPRQAGLTLPPDQWFTQKLDHNDPADDRTWQQRYQVNDTFYQPGGPVFLMIGGEGPATAIWVVAGQWIEYAQQYGALCFQLEHRFYGESRPTDDMSVENLKYLSSEQALADLAAFSAAMSEQYALPEGTKWVAFGGSYPGTLAAWYRLKYPDMVHAAVSTSAPLLAQTDFSEYKEVVKSSIYAKSGEQCYANVQQAFADTEQLLEHPLGWRSITSAFRLCSAFDGTSALDGNNLMQTLADRIEYVVQYNEDNRAFSGHKDANITIATVCELMNDESIGVPIERLAALNDLVMSINDETCIEHRYQALIDKMTDLDFDSDNNDATRTWIWQTCTEFGWYQTAEGSEQPFGQHIPLSYYIQQCVDAYGPEYDQSFVDAAVAATNAKYGARDLATSRVVLVNGSIDPWHAMGIIESSDPALPAVYINGTAHCANMYPARAEDSPELVAARQQVGELIGQWLQEE